jgi:hypothetical protein
MIRTVKARDMAKFSSLAKQIGLEVRFKVLYQGKEQIISDLRPELTAKGNPSSRTIRLKQNGKEARFDGRYEFQLMEPAEIFRKSK